MDPRAAVGAANAVLAAEMSSGTVKARTIRQAPMMSMPNRSIGCFGFFHALGVVLQTCTPMPDGRQRPAMLPGDHDGPPSVRTRL